MIYLTITRVYPANEWRTIPAGLLAQAVTQPVALKPMGLMGLFAGAQVAGADVSEFRAVWQYSEFVRRVEDALSTGNLAGAHGLLAVCPVEFTGDTLRALQTVLATNTLRAIDTVALERRETPPETVDAFAVTAALEAAGYTWDGSAWGYRGGGQVGAIGGVVGDGGK